jgi:hypothetical protein
MPLPTRIQVYATLTIAAIVWTAWFSIQGTPLHLSDLKPFSVTAAVIVAVFEAFDRWAWRLGPLPRLIGIPDLRGTWTGQLRSTFVDKETGKSIEPIEVYLVVRQTYSRIRTALLTKESKSTSLVSSLDCQRDTTPTIQWTYRNIPALLLQSRSRIHHGAVMMDIHGSPARRLTGFYWTDRDTKGELTFEGRTKSIHSDFDAAHADTYSGVRVDGAATAGSEGQ